MPTQAQLTAYQQYLANFNNGGGRSNVRSEPSNTQQILSAVPTASRLAFGNNNVTGGISDLFGVSNAIQAHSPGQAILPAASLANRAMPGVIPGGQYLGPAAVAYNLLKPGQNRNDYARDIVTGAPALIGAAGAGTFGAAAAATVAASPLLAGIATVFPWIGAALVAYQLIKGKDVENPKFQYQFGHGENNQFSPTTGGLFGPEGTNVNQIGDPNGVVSGLISGMKPVDQAIYNLLTPEQRAAATQRLGQLNTHEFSFPPGDPNVSHQLQQEYIAQKYGTILQDINPVAAAYIKNYGGTPADMLNFLNQYATNPNTPVPQFNPNIKIPGGSSTTSGQLLAQTNPNGIPGLQINSSAPSITGAVAPSPTTPAAPGAFAGGWTDVQGNRRDFNTPVSNDLDAQTRNAALLAQGIQDPLVTYADQYGNPIPTPSSVFNSGAATPATPATPAPPVAPAPVIPAAPAVQPVPTTSGSPTGIDYSANNQRNLFGVSNTGIQLDQGMTRGPGGFGDTAMGGFPGGSAGGRDSELFGATQSA